MLLQSKQVAAAFAWSLLVGTGVASTTALAQAPDGKTEAPPAAAEGVPAAVEVTQFKITDAQVKGFIASQADIAAISDKIQAGGDNPSDELKKELEDIAKKHGFSNFKELDDVAANISIVMAGLEPATGAFTDPLDALKKELADIEKDASIPEDEKKQLVEELSEAIKTTPPLEHKENIEIVKAHREAIEKALQ